MERVFKTIILSLFIANTITAQQLPYPQSPVIKQVNFIWPSHIRLASGSDNWPVTWADDDNQYTVWGDGGGFGGTNDIGRSSIGVARVEDNWHDFKTTNVWGGYNAENDHKVTGKSYGIVCINSVLYMWVGMFETTTDPFKEVKIAWSEDHGATWKFTDWSLDRKDCVMMPTICNYGKNYQRAKDEYVYSYLIRFQSYEGADDYEDKADYLNCQKPGLIDLVRVHKDEILNRDAYTFFAGMEGDNPIWTKEITNRKPVFENADGVGWCINVSYNEGLGRYLLSSEHTESHRGNFGIFDAPEPWGPWTTVLYEKKWGEGHVPLNTFFWNFSNKWTSEDGQSFSLIFTGRKENDSFNLIRGKFVLVNTKSVNKQTNKDPSNDWKVIGPGGGGGVMKPTISPFDENLVMTHCDMTAAYLSVDGGKNWEMKNLWNVPEDFEFDPVDSNTIYVATRGFRYSEDRGSGLSVLYKSTDKGKSWEIVFPDVSNAKQSLENLQNYDYLPSEIIDGAIDGTIEKVAVDPNDNQRIYLGVTPLKQYIGGNNDSEIPDSVFLVRSGDQGKTWETIARISGESVKAVFPAGEIGQKDKVIVFTESACVRVNKSTGQTKRFPLPVSRVIAVEGGKDKNGNGLVYIQTGFTKENGKTEGGMFVSKDQGESWSAINTGLIEPVADGDLPAFRKGLAVCETQADVAYISVISPEKNEKGEIDQIFCIYKTTNAGVSWKPMLRSSSRGGYLTNNFEGSWMEKSYDPGWGGAPIDLGVAPQNPDVCFAGDNGRGYKTVDGGKTWKQTYSHNLADGSYASGGLDVTTCYGVHFDPFDKDHFFICYTDMGLFHTFNAGESWFHALAGIPREWQNTCYEVEFDPEVKGKVWSVWANAHDLPRTKMFGPRGFDYYQGGVAVSDDHGKTWRKSNNGMPENAICTNVLLDPSTPADSRTLYVSVFDKGVYKSVDGGKNWEEANTGLGNNLFAWELRQNSKGRLFVLCARGVKEGNIVDGMVYYSDDEATSWKQLSLPEGVNGPHDLLVDPENTQRMYLSCWPRKTDTGDVNGGVYKTEDGGESWKQVFDQRIRVNAADIDPENNNILYINTFQNAAYRSTDFGESWDRIEGYRFKWGQRPVPDPNNPGMLFLTTYGGSVFYGPAKGVENEKQVIKNMPENWW